MAVIAERVVMNPAIMGGSPTIRGTRVTVSAILGQLGAGSIVELLADYPTLEHADILAALEFAARSVR